MKLANLCVATFAVALMASEALALTFGFTATRLDLDAPGGLPGSATEFASSAAGATLSGTFSFDRNQPVVDELVSPNAVFYRFGGPSRITINGPAGTRFVADMSGFPPLSTGAPTGFGFQDAEPTSGFSDLFVISNVNTLDLFILQLANRSAELFTGPVLPDRFELGDFDRTRLFLVANDDVTPGFLSYELTSLTQIPLPAPAVMLLGGLAGLGVIARRKRLG